MAYPRTCSKFSSEPQRGGARPPEPRIPRPVDFSHSARAERRQDLVGAETGARAQGHPKREVYASCRRGEVREPGEQFGRLND